MATLDKALSLLGLFNHTQPEFGLSALSRASGFDKATTLRLARSLVTSGLLEQDQRTRGYRLGAEILRLANLREGLYPLRSVVQPVAQQLSEALDETVHVAARSGDRLGTVLSVESSRAVRVVVEPGLSLPWHSTASGLALLAVLPAGERDHLLATATPPLDELTQSRRTPQPGGYTVSRDRFEDGVTGIAAVFFDNRDHAVGTIAVAVSSDTLSGDRTALLGTRIVDAAAGISAQLGATPQRLQQHRASPPAA
ncbi:MAG: IclR family transcriptional regulator [Pseudomonadota bacterium]